MAAASPDADRAARSTLATPQGRDRPDRRDRLDHEGAGDPSLRDHGTERPGHDDPGEDRPADHGDVSLDRTDDAVEWYRKALSDTPRDPDKHANLAYTLDAAGRHAEAVAEFDAFDRLRPFHGGVRESRLLALHALGRISSVELAALATAAR